MRSLVFIGAMGISLLAAAQQQQPQPQSQPQQIDKETQERLRVERAAGGVRQITPEEKASADAGAGPHQTRPSSGQSRKRADDKTIPGEESSRGGTR